MLSTIGNSNVEADRSVASERRMIGNQPLLKISRCTHCCLRPLDPSLPRGSWGHHGSNSAISMGFPQLWCPPGLLVGPHTGESPDPRRCSVVGTEQSPSSSRQLNLVIPRARPSFRKYYFHCRTCVGERRISAWRRSCASRAGVMMTCEPTANHVPRPWLVLPVKVRTILRRLSLK